MQRPLRIFNTKTVFRSLIDKSLVWITLLILVSSSLGLAQNSATEINLNLEQSFGNTFLVDNFSTTSNNLSVGFIHMQSQNSSLLFDGGAKVGIANLIADTWGYSEKGFEISLTGKSNPYATNGLRDTSSELLLSTSYFESLDSLTGMSISKNLGLSGFTEFSLQAGYDATDSTSPFSAFGTIGYRQSFDTQLPIVTSAVRIERISVEPKVRAWYDSDLSFGADVSVRADTSIFNTSNLSLGLEGGYTDGFWYNFTVNSPIKF